ncbi:MAG: FecR family protein [Lentisphaeria bacterium]|nr:FecR family protein [Lentisphaeria bacterium]
MLRGIILICISLSLVAEDSFKLTGIGGKKDVKVLKDGKFISVTINSEYKFGTTIKTGRKSTADLEMSPKNTFRLMPRTKLTIIQDLKNPKLKILKLEEGTVSIKLDDFPKGNKLQVETPTSICGALGTRFVVVFEDSGDDEKAAAKKGSRENKFKCEKGEIFASSRFTFGDKSVEGKTLNVASIKAGTEITAIVHEGLQNSYTDISVNRGELTIDYGVSDGAKFVLKAEKDKPARFICALEKSNESVKSAVLEVKSGIVKSVTRKKFLFKEKEVVKEITLEHGPVLVYQKKIKMQPKNSTIMKDYLVAAKKEAELHSKLVDKTKIGEETDFDKQRVEEAAKKATTLRKKIMSKSILRSMRAIQRAGARSMRR